MDNLTIFTKTAKGLGEAMGKTKTLSRRQRQLLKEIDGSSTVAELAARLGMLEAVLMSELATLEEANCIQAFASGDAEPDLDFSAAPAPARDPLTVVTMGEFMREMAAQAQPAADADVPVQDTVFSGSRDQSIQRAVADAFARIDEEKEAQDRAADAAVREIQEQARRTREEKARRDAEARARREAEEAARREAETRARQEAEADARRKAEERQRVKEAVARIRKEAIDKYKQDVEARARREQEEQARREAEEQARRAAEEAARREAEQRVREDAEQRARREAEELAQRLAEERSRREAEEAERLRREREAAELAARLAEEQERRERESAEQARLLAEEQVRREAEEAARREAEEQARRLAQRLQQEQEAHEAAARAERVALERAREEAQARAAQEAEERTLRKKAEKALREERKRAEKLERQERAAREAEQRREREKRALEERLQAERRRAEEALREAAQAGGAAAAASTPNAGAAEEAAAPWDDLTPDQPVEELHADDLHEALAPLHDAGPHDAPESSSLRLHDATIERAAPREDEGSWRHVRAPGKRLDWRKPAAAAAVLAVATAVALPMVMPLSGRAAHLEQVATAQLGQPVRIGAVRLGLLPQPHWRIDGIVIGSQQQVRIAAAEAYPPLSGVFGMFGDDARFDTVSLRAAVFSEEGLGWAVFGRPATALPVNRITLHQARLASDRATLPAVDGQADIDASGRWKRIDMHTIGEAPARIALTPDGDAIAVDILADKFIPPFGRKLALEKFHAAGRADRRQLALTELNGGFLGGTLSGHATLSWSGAWQLQGEVRATDLDMAAVAPALLEGGRLEGRASFAMKSAGSDRLFAAPRLSGAALIRNGVLPGVNLANALRGGDASGKSPFSEMRGAFTLEQGTWRLRDLRLSAGLLSTSGSAEIDAGGKLAGRFSVDLQSSARALRGSMALGGTLTRPEYRY